MTPCGTKYLRNRRLVVVLQKVNQPSQVLWRAPPQVLPNRFRVAFRESLVELVLVVAVVEALLLKRPLAIRIGFRNQDQFGVSAPHWTNDMNPEVDCRNVAY